MAYNQVSNKEWQQKEKRDLFIRVVNTLFMSGDKTSIKTAEEIIKTAKTITDKAFEFYPPPEVAEQAGDPELPTIDQ